MRDGVVVAARARSVDEKVEHADAVAGADELAGVSHRHLVAVGVQVPAACVTAPRRVRQSRHASPVCATHRARVDEFRSAATQFAVMRARLSGLRAVDSGETSIISLVV